jgi:hypothetical protein
VVFWLTPWAISMSDSKIRPYSGGSPGCGNCLECSAFRPLVASYPQFGKKTQDAQQFYSTPHADKMSDECVSIGGLKTSKSIDQKP